MAFIRFETPAGGRVTLPEQWASQPGYKPTREEALDANGRPLPPTPPAPKPTPAPKTKEND